MKNIVITGGNSGIGYAIAKLSKDKGYDVSIIGRDSMRVGQAAEELGVTGLIADIGNVGDLKHVAERYLQSGLDVLVNNAAIARFMPIEVNSEADYEEFFNTNIRGPMMLSQLMLPALEKRKGCITNISSAIVNNGLPNATLYAATKGAVESFSRSLAVEFAPKGIRVNVVSPGAVNTPLLGKLGVPEEQVEAVKAHQEQNIIPLGRYANPDEIAHVVLAQIEADYVTGSVWNADGGLSAQ